MHNTKQYTGYESTSVVNEAIVMEQDIKVIIK